MSQYYSFTTPSGVKVAKSHDGKITFSESLFNIPFTSFSVDHSSTISDGKLTSCLGVSGLGMSYGRCKTMTLPPRSLSAPCRLVGASEQTSRSGGIDASCKNFQVILGQGFQEALTSARIGRADGLFTVDIGSTSQVFKVQTLYVALLCTLNGWDHQIYMSLDPAGTKYSRRLEPYNYLHSSPVGASLLAADLLLKQLHQGYDLTKLTAQQAALLKKLGYKSARELRKKFPPNFGTRLPKGLRIWIQPTEYCAVLNADGLQSRLDLGVCYECDLELPWETEFCRWITDALPQLESEFPELAAACDLLRCTAFVKTLRAVDFDFRAVENLAIREAPRCAAPIPMLLDTKLLEYPLKVGGKIMSVRGGICVNDWQDSSLDAVIVRTSFDGKTDLQQLVKSAMPLGLAAETVYRLRVGFRVHVSEKEYETSYVAWRVAKCLGVPADSVKLFAQSSALGAKSCERLLRLELHF